MWNGRDIPTSGDRYARCLQRPYCGLTAGTRTFDENLYLPQPVVHGPPCRILSGTLCRESRTFACPFEPHGSSATRSYDVAFRVGQGNQRIVKG